MKVNVVLSENVCLKVKVVMALFYVNQCNFYVKTCAKNYINISAPS